MLERWESPQERVGAMQTCSDSEASWLEYEVLSDPGVYLCQKELWVLGSHGRSQGKGSLRHPDR